MILVFGSAGQLGTAFANLLGADAVCLTRADVDLADLDAVAELLTSRRPEVVVNCAAYTAVDRAEEEGELADLVNGFAVQRMAATCAEIEARFATFSTDYVFNGENNEPYVESDAVEPVNRYGASKALGERLALEANPESLVVRTSWVLSGTHRSFATTMLRLAREGGARVVDDQVGRPTLVDDLAPAVLAAIEHGVTGLLHLTNEGTTTWFGLAREVVEIAGLDPSLIEPCPTADYPTPAKRPAYSVLASERDTGIELPHYRPSLERAVVSLLEAGF